MDDAMIGTLAEASAPPLAILSLAGTVLASSILGSAHCAGMCGGVALIAIGSDGRSHVARQVGYHAGRLASYAIVGAACGLVGSAIDDAGTLVGVQRVASIAAGVTIALFGLVAILRACGVRVPSAGVPKPLVLLAQRAHVRAMRLPSAWRGVPLGLATPLLPCGWLYAFAAIAAGSASPAIGALVMAAFWLGTVPALVIASNGARLAFARLGRAAPVIAGVAMIAVGLHAAVWRAGVAEDAARGVELVRLASHASGDAQRGPSAVGASDDCERLVQQAAGLADELPPCCRARAASDVAAASAGDTGEAPR